MKKENMEHYDFKKGLLSKNSNADAHKHLMQEDLDILIGRALYVKQRMDAFPRFTIKPVADIQKGLRQGGFTEIHESVNRLMPAKPAVATGQKEIVLARFREKEYCTDTIELFQRPVDLLLKEYRLKFLENPLPYFLGLMAHDFAANWQVTRACHAFLESEKSEANKTKDDSFLRADIHAQSKEEDSSIGICSVVNPHNTHIGRTLSHWEEGLFYGGYYFHLMEAI